MARKSNKTAHVLNLLAGHDTAKDADEQASAVQQTSDDTRTQGSHGAPAKATAQANAERTAGQAVSAGRNTASGNAAQSAAPAAPPAPASSPAVPAQNNIAMIDKTGEDPVAKLIQQKLTSEFEKQIQEAQPESLKLTDAEPLPENLELTEAEPLPENLELADAEPLPENLELTDAEPLPDGLELTDAEPLPDGLELTDAEPLAEGLELTSAEPISEAVPSDISMKNSKPASGKDTTAASTADMNHEKPVSDFQGNPVPAETPMQDTTSILQTAAASAQESVPEPEEDFAAINVMEHIVKDKIIYYMRQFDVCTCNRCKADVMALTLNGLMPKYIVTMKAAVDPLLSYYTNRLISDVTVEATKACMVVKENPRH